MDELLAQIGAQVERMEHLVNTHLDAAGGGWHGSPDGAVNVRVDAQGRLRAIALADDWPRRHDWQALERIINDTVRRAVKMASNRADRSAA